jgi:CRP-like cAMP-binding protein
MANEIPSSLLRTVSAMVADANALCTALMAIATHVKAAKGTTLLQEGKICRHIYFVASGCLRAYTLNNGIEINTDFIFEGGFATSLRSLRAGSGSDIAIQTYEASELYRFESTALLDLYTKMPGAEAFGRTVVEQVLIRQEEHANMFRLFTGKERYQQLLATQPEIIQRVSLSQIASYIGIARETLSRIRRP